MRGLREAECFAALDAIDEAIGGLTLEEADAVLEAVRIGVPVVTGPTSNGNGKVLLTAYRAGGAGEANHGE